MSRTNGSTDMEMTSVNDGHTHVISAPDFDAGIWSGRGRYRARCGTEVVAASLATGPGPRCPACPHQRHRAPTPGPAARLIAALATLPGFAGIRGRNAA
jgi:hypothetical protein